MRDRSQRRGGVSRAAWSQVGRAGRRGVAVVGRPGAETGRICCGWSGRPVVVEAGDDESGELRRRRGLAGWFAGGEEEVGGGGQGRGGCGVEEQAGVEEVEVSGDGSQPHAAAPAPPTPPHRPIAQLPTATATISPLPPSPSSFGTCEKFGTQSAPNWTKFDGIGQILTFKFNISNLCEMCGDQAALNWIKLGEIGQILKWITIQRKGNETERYRRQS